mmetsp:Transcript_103118/g.315471  ORF Transcript_103118/g.315471 Transcript_103118/m.315471 type:complete len:225 (-) Transcript_103118:194-868(-)
MLCGWPSVFPRSTMSRTSRCSWTLGAAAPPSPKKSNVPRRGGRHGSTSRFPRHVSRAASRRGAAAGLRLCGQPTSSAECIGASTAIASGRCGRCSAARFRPPGGATVALPAWRGPAPGHRRQKPERQRLRLGPSLRGRRPSPSPRRACRRSSGRGGPFRPCGLGDSATRRLSLPEGSSGTACAHPADGSAQRRLPATRITPLFREPSDGGGDDGSLARRILYSR